MSKPRILIQLDSDPHPSVFDAVVETWNGRFWTVGTTPNASNSNLSGVSCNGAKVCTAVGDVAKGGSLKTLAERWNGTSWTVQPTPNPAGAVHSFLISVSCPSTKACIAVGFFTVGSAFAQLATTTSRVAVLSYTMPIWAALLALPVLGERLDRTRVISLMLCAAGLSVLIYPLIGSSHLIGVAIALVTAVAWAAGTVYLKWARVDADLLAIAAWQLVTACVVALVGALLVEGGIHLWPVQPLPLGALIFSALVGSAFAYLLWFEIVRRLPATTASLGVLSAPVIGAVASMLILGERPTLADFMGFALTLSAAACVVLAPNVRASETAPIEQ